MNGDTRADRRVHPATVPLRFVKDAPSTLLGLPAAYAFVSKGSLLYVLGFAALVGIVVLFLYWLAWRRFRYGVGAGDLVIESGLLTRTRRSIPFDRIQDVDIERGPLQRLFGLATVRIETGGGATDEGLIDSVTVAEADRLRAAVRAGQAGAAPVIADAANEVSVERTIFAMSPARVFVAGVFNFSLVYLAALFGTLQSFKEMLPFDIYDLGRWIGLVDDRLPGRFGIGAAVAVGLVALLLGVLFGIARTLARDHGFRLGVEGARFRRTRGLFTRSEVVLAKSRVQLALMRTGPARRAAGWGELDFQTLSGRAAAGQRQNVAPLATTDEMASILAEQGRLRMPVESALVPVSSRHAVRALATKALMPALAILIVSTVWRPALFGLAVVPLLAAAALLERRFHRYALAADLLFVRRGVWRQQLWIVPVASAQCITMTRGLLQRRLGLASVAIDTAGGSAFGGPRIVDLRVARARELLAARRDGLVTAAGSPAPTNTAHPYRS